MMNAPFRFRSDWVMLMALGIAVGLVALYTYGALFRIPLIGFAFDRDGRIDAVASWAETPDLLQAGDILIRVGDLAYADHLENIRQPLLINAFPAAGEVVALRILRNGQELDIIWRMPQPSWAAYLGRATNQWPLAWVYLACGLFAYLLVRPRDRRWALLVAFNALTAIWLAAGTLSLWRLWESALVLRMVVWVCVPVYVFWHWSFPQPLRPLSGIVRGVGYAIGLLLAGAELADVVPRDAYFGGFALAVLVSLLILIAQYLWRPQQRADLNLLLRAGVLALLPTLLAFGWLLAFGPVGRNIFGALLGLPMLPLTYLYVVYRRQLGGLELRANQAAGVYLFLLLVGSAFSLAAFTLFAQPGAAEWGGWLAIGLAIGAILITALGLGPFQRFVERRILRIPAPQFAGYFTQLALNPSRAGLIRVLRDEAARRLLIRQSALLAVEADGRVTPLYAAMEGARLPDTPELPALLARPDVLRPPLASPDEPLPWVRVALPLRLGERLIGLWLLGRRDPDDFYSQVEIGQLRALADYAAVALAHTEQTERFRELYQANIDRHEAERERLALELHDEILNELALLATSLNAPTAPDAVYGRVVQRIRQIISGLRPVMLSYGLASALEQLGDELSERTDGQLSVQVALQGAGERYPAPVEQHLFRIAQQAAENALKHAQARTLRLAGQLTPSAATLFIDDDGIGLPEAARGDLGELIRQRHFGLAGMRERAHLIGAELLIESAQGQGTRLTVRWREPALRDDAFSV